MTNFVKTARSNCGIISITLIALLIVFHAIGSRPYWLDEAYSVLFAAASWSDLLRFIVSTEMNMGLYHLVLKWWIGLFGDGESATRALSAIFALGGLLMTYRIGSRLFSQKVGLTAAALIAVNAMFVQYAQEARGYSLLLMLSTVSIYLFIEAVETRRSRFYICLAIVNAMIGYTHLFGVLLFIAQAVSVLFLPPCEVAWKKLISSFLATGLLLTPFGIALLGQQSPPFDWVPELSFRTVYSFLVALSGGGGKVLLCAYAALVVIGVVHFIRSHGPFRRGFLFWRSTLVYSWLSVPIVSVIGISFFKPFLMGRYLIFCLPAFVLAAALGAVAINNRVLLPAGVAVAIGLSAHALVFGFFPKERSDWRAATEYILQNAEDRDGIIFNAWVGQVPFSYYRNKSSAAEKHLTALYRFPLKTPAIDMMRNATVAVRVSPAAVGYQKHDRLWIVHYLDGLESMNWGIPDFKDTIRRDYRPLKYEAFKDINVHLYVRKSDDGATR